MFWTRFLILCARENLSPNAVAEKLGLSSGSITAWKKGTAPRLTTVYKIAEFFGVSVDFLLGKTDDTGGNWGYGGGSASGSGFPDGSGYGGPLPGGEKFIKEKPATPEGGELSPAKQEAWDLIQNLDDEKLRKVIQAIKLLLEK